MAVTKITDDVIQSDSIDSSQIADNALISSSRTNVLSRSEQMSSWGKEANLTVEKISFLPPPFGITPSTLSGAGLHRITEGAVNTRHWVGRTPPIFVGPNQDYTFSIFLREGSRRYAGVVFGMSASPFNRTATIYDLRTGLVTSSFNFGSGVVTTAYAGEDYGNGWFRFSVTIKTDSSTNQLWVEVFPSFNGTSVNYLGNFSDFYVYGGQVESGIYPTQYIANIGDVTNSVTDCDKILNDTITSEKLGEGTIKDIVSLDDRISVIKNTGTGTYQIKYNLSMTRQVVWVTNLRDSPFFTPENNYYDVLPPSGKTVQHLIGFIPKLHYMHIGPVGAYLNNDDSIRCRWEYHNGLGICDKNSANRIRIWLQQSKMDGYTNNDLLAYVEYLAIWK